MAPSKILDAFSETLMQDGRILCEKERELLLCLLQNSKNGSSKDADLQFAVKDAITRAVGETIAQRAFNVLGTSIVERILSGAVSAQESVSTPVLRGTPQPPSPNLTPQPPSPNVVPTPPRSTPQPPGSTPAGTPQPPSGPSGSVNVGIQGKRQKVSSGIQTPVMEAALPRYVVLDEFLAPHEVDDLVQYTLQHEGDFEMSEVISPNGEPGVIDYSHRRSRVLMDLGKHHAVIMQRVRAVLPLVARELGIEEFPVRRVEAQITASNDGDFFAMHSDNGQEQVASRRLTFVYFFNREPRPFQGGELRLYDLSDTERSNNYQTIVPQQNQIIFFPCAVMHEITPIECGSKDFADSRFTLNGWLHN